MNIPETFHFDKDGEVVRFPWLKKLFLTLVIILVAFLAFVVGRLTGHGGGDVVINTSAVELVSEPKTDSPGAVFASSQGTRYYYSDCRNTISEKNKISFASSAMAEAAGYTLA